LAQSHSSLWIHNALWTARSIASDWRGENRRPRPSGTDSLSYRALVLSVARGRAVRARRDPAAERTRRVHDADQEERVVTRGRDARELTHEARVAPGAQRDGGRVERDLGVLANVADEGALDLVDRPRSSAERGSVDHQPVDLERHRARDEVHAS